MTTPVIQVLGDTQPRQSVLLIHVSHDSSTLEARAWAHSDRPSFDDQALGFANKLRWTPATKNGQPVDAWVLLGVIPSAKATPAATTEETQGFLMVDANPLGTVFIDGIKVGGVPIMRYGVKPGLHTIRIESPGYKTETLRVQVSAGTTVRQVVQLEGDQ
jgi:PEGA domain/Gram-negative bacterial TonB protein C-terminal